MKQLNKDKSMDDILRDTKHNSKAKHVFLKLLAKQKKPKNPFDELRSKTYYPDNKSNPRNELEI